MANQFQDQLSSRKLFLCPDRRVGQPLTKRQFLRFVPIPQQPVMSDLHEPFRQNMKQESSDKLHRRKRHHFFLVFIGIVPPFECGLTVPDIQDPVVGNRYPVGIPAQIVNHSGRILEWRFAVCDPLKSII